MVDRASLVVDIEFERIFSIEDGGALSGKTVGK